MDSKINFLIGKREQLLHQKAGLLLELEQAEQTIRFDDDTKLVLKQLQGQFATKSTEAYSELLSAIIQDVLGENEPKVVLQPNIRGNRPALDIFTVDQDGQETEIEEQGGSISNLIAAGLRFIGLALSTNRRFCLLDEADCWLEGRHSPLFMNVIDKLCSQIGVQALVISHNKDMLEELNMSVARLTYNEQGDVVCSMFERKGFLDSNDKQLNADLTEGSGLRFIRLQNIMSHVDTTIRLDAGLTALVGGNNIGKSVVTRAMRGLLSNTRSRPLIRRGASLGTVTLGLEDNMELSWSLQANDKGLPKASYLLKNEQGDIVFFEQDVLGVPEVVESYLAMQPSSDGVSLNIGDQRDPLFILNPLISTHKRADLIKLGHEFAVVNGMIKKHQENIVEAKRERQTLSKRLDSENEQLARLKPLTSVDLLNKQQRELAQEINQLDEGMKVIAGFASRCQAPDMSLSFLSQYFSSYDGKYQAGSQLGIYLKGTQEVTSQSAIIGLLHDLPAPAVAQNELLRCYLAGVDTEASLSTLELISSVAELALPESAQDLEKIYLYIREEAYFAQSHEQMIDDLKAGKTIKEQLKEMGRLCPTCQQPIQAMPHRH